MKNIALPEPPNPNMYRNNADGYNQAMYQWASNMKSQLQIMTREIARPAPQPFTVGTYTVSNSITGSDALSNVANVLCTLINTLIQSGLLTPIQQNQ